MLWLFAYKPLNSGCIFKGEKIVDEIYSLVASAPAIQYILQKKILESYLLSFFFSEKESVFYCDLIYLARFFISFFL